jgi:hypothetical protein
MELMRLDSQDFCKVQITEQFTVKGITDDEDLHLAVHGVVYHVGSSRRGGHYALILKHGVWRWSLDSLHVQVKERGFYNRLCARTGAAFDMGVDPRPVLTGLHDKCLENVIFIAAPPPISRAAGSGA